MKFLPSILASIILSMLVGLSFAHAQSYVPLAPLPVGEGGTTPASYTFTSYLLGMIKLLIGLGGAMAVLFAIIGGTKYVAASTNPSLKATALEDLWGALIGLAIILSSYLLLNSINPKLVEFKLLLEPVKTKPLETFAGTVTWGNDSAIRNVLASQDIKVNRSNCTKVGQENCTSVFGLSGQAQVGLQALARNCALVATGAAGNKCDVTITGGTEKWLHKSHNDGTKVDLSQGGAGGILNSYIKKGKILSITNCGVPTDPHYQPDGPSGGTYVDEPNRDSNADIIPNGGRHWHVCY